MKWQGAHAASQTAELVDVPQLTTKKSLSTERLFFFQQGVLISAFCLERLFRFTHGLC